MSLHDSLLAKAFCGGAGGGSASIDVTAQVGQTIIVKEVDASGKPTKWESADYQPRTHWTEEVVILPDTHLQFVDGQLEIPTQYAPITLNGGETYKIMWNGVEYSCICTEMYMDGARCLIVGNFSAASGTGDTGEPFVIIATEEVVAMMALDGSTSVTLSVKGTVFKPIPVQYVTNAFPYYIEVEGNGNVDNPYVCNDTVENVMDAYHSGMPIKLRCKLGDDAVYSKMEYTLGAYLFANGERALGFYTFYAMSPSAVSAYYRLWLIEQADGTWLVREEQPSLG